MDNTCDPTDSSSSTVEYNKHDDPRVGNGAPKTTPAWLKRPLFADICGNHAMVNAERQMGNAILRPLQRCLELDQLARAHAQDMASYSTVYHADPNQLYSQMNTNNNIIRLGSNVAKGRELRELHNKMKRDTGNYTNLMDKRYKEFGIGTARDANGELFLCQVFRG